MKRLKEVAKFICGFEAFHAVCHAYLWYTDTTFMAFGITMTPNVNLMGAVINAVVSVVVGIYAWGQYEHRMMAQR